MFLTNNISFFLFITNNAFRYYKNIKSYVKYGTLLVSIYSIFTKLKAEKCKLNIFCKISFITSHYYISVFFNCRIVHDSFGMPNPQRQASKYST